MSMNSQYVFPHLKNKKQKKEIPYIFCYNIRIVRDNSNSSDYNEYVFSIKKFIEENKHLLVNWNDISNSDKFYKRIFENDNNTDKSVYWDIKFISASNKKEIDDLLNLINYPKKIDKFGFIYEGCYNDDKLFIGGRNEMINHYCKFFPITQYCKNIFTKNESDRIDKFSKKVLDDPELFDQMAEKWLKSFKL